MRIHLLGLAHTITHTRFSHCAFTGKVRRFAPMVQSVGYDVIHYGVEGAESGAKEQVDVLPATAWAQLGGREPGTQQIGVGLSFESLLYQEFNRRLTQALRARVEPRDIIAFPFGYAHYDAIRDPVIQRAYFLESGIGYPAAWTPFRVYESQAWMHFHLGRAGLPSGRGSDYWWVVPNYYDPDDWPRGDGAGDYIAYLGRLNQDKGLDIVLELARACPDLRFVLCGQGDPTRWLRVPNIEYRPPIHGKGVAEYLGRARCVVMPTRYVEPFGGVAAEAMLCGTPVLGSTFGAFTETITHGTTGYRCRVLQDWIDALGEVVRLNRRRIRMMAQQRYSMWILASEYAKIFEQLADLGQAGWATRR